MECLFQANIGQDEDFDVAEAKALRLGAKKVSVRVHFNLT